MSDSILFAVVLSLSTAFFTLIYAVFEVCSAKGRNVTVWMILSFIISPLVVAICLSCMGETEEKRKERLLADKKFIEDFHEDD